ncbi:hypothetical protein GE061_006479 [Apolygus lucorum]|uniref:Uncharacterized protein n=1 Tax=Apolygus lucorum TaxID=248454 RepID=A0A8S9WVP9_APOLU|nr:hypothetical protein GE061_006479 [Apolygus lucorum]
MKKDFIFKFSTPSKTQDLTKFVGFSETPFHPRNWTSQKSKQKPPKLPSASSNSEPEEAIFVIRVKSSSNTQVDRCRLCCHCDFILTPICPPLSDPFFFPPPPLIPEGNGIPPVIIGIERDKGDHPGQWRGLARSYLSVRQYVLKKLKRRLARMSDNSRLWTVRSEQAAIIMLNYREVQSSSIPL